MTAPQLPQDEKLIASLRSTLEPLGLRPIDRMPPAASVPRQRMRTNRPPAVENVELLLLTRRDGVLRWESSFAGTPPGGYGAGRAGRAAVAGGAVLQQFVFERLQPSAIGKALGDLDATLTPNHRTERLRELRGIGVADHVPFQGDTFGKKVLLLIHGTFSNGDMFRTEFAAAPDHAGGAFLAAARQKYDLVLTFDHPTVGVSPAINAFDLASLLKSPPASVDVVAHSRGGLVTRWWLEAFADPKTKRRAMLVGSPLAGTSLAAPAQLRSGLNFLTNVGDVLQRTTDAAGIATALPLISAAAALMRVVNSITRFAAGAPLIDAAVAMIPGLSAQSRSGSNSEIVSLRRNTGNAGLEYYTIKAAFEPKDQGWAFWRYFVSPKQHLAGWAADLVFDGDNDLVVDAASMGSLADNADIDEKRTLDFGTTSSVHHTNYFRQTETIDFIRKKFKIE